jgi:hypothetical protein
MSILKPIPQDLNYGVNELGEVFSLRFNRKLKGTINSNGYMQLFTSKESKSKAYLVHRLVWNAFVGEIPQGFELDHIDRNPLNNALSNLRLVTRQQNKFNTSAKGYCWNKLQNKWQGYITVSGKTHFLGLFEVEEEARNAYLAAKEIYHVI